MVVGFFLIKNIKTEFIYSNLSIQTNVINSAYICGVKNLIFLGSSCVTREIVLNQLKKIIY